MNGHSRFNLYLATITVNIASFSMGNHLTWTSPTVPMLTKPNDIVLINKDDASWLGSLIALGCIFGPFIGGAMVDRVGRKWTITFAGLCQLISWVILLLARSTGVMYAGRVVGGLGVGIVYTIVPIYVAEIAEDELRGALGSVMTLFLNSGFLLEYVVGPLTSYTVLILASMVSPILLLLVFPAFMPETPYYLLQKGREDEAFKSLSWLRKGASTEDLKKELHLMKVSVENSQQQSGTVVDLLSTVGNRKGLLISCVLVAGQQLSGITVVLFNTQSIFQDAGSDISPSLSAVIIAIMLMLTAGICGPLVKCFGMKWLLVISPLLCGSFQGLLGLYFFMKSAGSDLVSSLSWLPILSLIGYVTTYAIGLGTLPWAVMAEMFPSNVKAIGSSISASFCWVIGFLMTKFFINISEDLGQYISFWMFTVFCVLIMIFTLIFLPDTRGMSFDEIQDILNGRRRKSVDITTKL